MTQHNRHRNTIAAILATTAMAFSLGAISAHAADGSDGALPAAAEQNGITFLSGGVGLDESKAIKAAAAHWPLSLSFIGGQRDFVADVDVVITDSSGQKILETSSKGPYMLLRLKPGKYTVEATYSQKTQKKSVSVTAHGHAQLRFDWKQT